MSMQDRKKPFMGKRAGRNVSRHLDRKSSDFLMAKVRRLDQTDPTQVKVGNICLGILRSRGIKI